MLCSLGPPSFPAEDVAVAQSHTFALFCFTTDNDLAITEAAPPPAAAPPAAVAVFNDEEAAKAAAASEVATAVAAGALACGPV